MTETTVPTARSPLVVEKKLSPLNSSRTKLSYNLSKAEFYGAHSNKLNVEVRGDDLKFTRVKKPKDPNKPNSRIWTSLPSEPIPLRLTFVPQERGPIFYIDIDDLEFKNDVNNNSKPEIQRKRTHNSHVVVFHAHSGELNATALHIKTRLCFTDDWKPSIQEAGPPKIALDSPTFCPILYGEEALIFEELKLRVVNPKSKQKFSLVEQNLSKRKKNTSSIVFNMGTLEKPKSQSPLDSGPIKSPVKSEPILLHVEFSVSAQPKTQYLCTPTKAQPESAPLRSLSSQQPARRPEPDNSQPQTSYPQTQLFKDEPPENDTFSWASEILNGPLNTPNELDLPLFNTPNESDFSLSNIPNESDFPPLNASNGPTLADFNDFHEPFFEDY